MGKVFTIQAKQAGRTIPVVIDYDRMIWSGLSWAAGEIGTAGLDAHQPVLIRISSADKDAVVLEGKVYRVEY
jgi:hypothetical protein